MFPPALAIQQANDAVPGTVPKITGPNLYLQSDSAGKGAIWTGTVTGGTTPTLFYADQATRRAVTLTVGMLYSVARQASDGSLWIVIPPLSGTTPVWGLLSPGPENITPPGPLVVMVGHVVAGYIPESGLSSTGWLDAGPNGYNLTGTCTVQTNQINGYSCAKGNGTTDYLHKTQALAAPATTPLYRYTVVRIDTHVNNITICALGSANAQSVLMHSSSGQVSQFSAGAYGNVDASGCTTGAFKLIKAKFSGSTADSIKAGGGTLVTGTACANTAPDAIQLLGSNSSFAAVSIAEDWIFNQDPGTSLDSYFTTKFPGCET